jgi:hypothetical protein
MTQYIVKTETSTSYFCNEAKTIYPREDGPALVNSDGSEFWYLENQLHRVGGPACTYGDGLQIWLQYGEKHNLHGPAFIDPVTGVKEYWLYGKYKTKEQFDSFVKDNQKEETINIEGKALTLKELKDIINSYYSNRI